MRTVETLLRVKRVQEQPVAVKQYETEPPKIIDVLIALVAAAILGGVVWLCILELVTHPEILEIIAVSGGVVALVVLAALLANSLWKKTY